MKVTNVVLVMVLVATTSAQGRHPMSKVDTLAIKLAAAADLSRRALVGVRAPLSFVPNDPLAAQQWHLTNDLGYADVNIDAAWALGYTGRGVTIGVVDDGVQWDHPDLYENYSAADSFDFGSYVPNPNPAPRESNTPWRNGDNHGTAVAGIAAARGGNGTGVTGAAPFANLAGLRVAFGGSRNGEQFSDATKYRSTGPNPTIDIKNHSYGMVLPYIEAEDQVAALSESSAAGTIHVAAAGNARQEMGMARDANSRALQSSVDSIVVGALAHDGVFAPYSSWGANVFVTAPSGGRGLWKTTTDRTGDGVSGGYNYASGAGDYDPLEDLDYTSIFNGTSSAAPLVAGVLALAKEANPSLDSRMAKHLLARTSNSSIDAHDATESSDGGWKTNAAGFRFNQNYGFGLIDATALVLAATDYARVTPASQETTFADVGQMLPDAVVNDSIPGALTTTFELFEDGELEEMLIELDLDHSFAGDLQATLVSPAGTTSRLMMRDVENATQDLSWTFTSNAFWGENPAGEWSLTVEDWYVGSTGSWNSFSATATTGSLVAVPEPAAFWFAALAITAAACGRRTRGRLAPPSI